MVSKEKKTSGSVTFSFLDYRSWPIAGPQYLMHIHMPSSVHPGHAASFFAGIDLAGAVRFKKTLVALSDISGRTGCY